MVDKPKGGPGSLFILDANNLVFRAYHGLPPLTSADGRPIQAVHGYVRMVQALRKEFAPEYLLSVFDAPGLGIRGRMFPAYKANRAELPEDLIPQLDLVRGATTALGVPMAEVPEVEADDVIASYAITGAREGLEVVVVSSDKDLMQLVTEEGGHGGTIQMWDAMKSRLIGPPQVREKFGVGPDKLGDLLALTGDSVDNVPGVRGIGPKTAAELLNQHGDLEGVLAAAVRGDIKQTKRRESLVAQAEDARLSRRLVELIRDAPQPLLLAQLRDEGLHRDALESFFAPLGFRSTLAGLLNAASDAVARRRVAQEAEGASSSDGTSTAGTPSWPGPRAPMIAAGGDEGAVKAWLERARGGACAMHVEFEGSDPLRGEVLGIALSSSAAEVSPLYLGRTPKALLGHAGPAPWTTFPAALLEFLADPAQSKICHDHKNAALALGTLGHPLAGVGEDPMLMSYVLDAARSAHDLEALASDHLGHTLAPLAGRLGKGKKQIAVTQLALESVAEHVTARAEACHPICDHLRRALAAAPAPMRAVLDDIEMPLAGVLIDVERRGILLDVAELRRQSAELEAMLVRLRAQIETEAGRPINPESSKQLQELLFEVRGLPAGKKTKTGYSVDAQVLEELSVLDPIIAPILEHRSLAKLKGGYLDPLPLLVDPRTGRLHTQFRQAVAQTGRLSSSEPNLQNIPIRTEVGRRIRRAFVAPEGRRLVALDYSQIELRVLAHMSGDTAWCQAFRDGTDVHQRTAAEVFEVELGDVTAEQRRIAKAVNFGVIYGQQAFGLARALGIPRGKAAKYIKEYFRKIPGVAEFMETLVRRAKEQGYAETLAGRRRRIPELLARGSALAYGERIARNTPIQGSAADIMKIAMIQVERALAGMPWCMMLLTVHDELIFECDTERVEDLVDIARPLMEGAVELSVPLVVDVGSGRTWAEAKE